MEAHGKSTRVQAITGLQQAGQDSGIPVTPALAPALTAHFTALERAIDTPSPSPVISALFSQSIALHVAANTTPLAVSHVRYQHAVWLYASQRDTAAARVALDKSREELQRGRDAMGEVDEQGEVQLKYQVLLCPVGCCQCPRHVHAPLSLSLSVTRHSASRKREKERGGGTSRACRRGMCWR